MRYADALKDYWTNDPQLEWARKSTVGEVG